MGRFSGRGFHSLHWLFPVAVTAHNMEEAVAFPRFAASHSSQIPWAVGIVDLEVGLVILTVAAWAVTFMSWRDGRETIWSYLLFGYMIAMLVNVVVPHIPAAILFRGYTPGLVTALALNLPVMTCLSMRAIRERYVSGLKAVGFGVGVPIGLGMAIGVILWR